MLLRSVRPAPGQTSVNAAGDRAGATGCCASTTSFETRDGQLRSRRGLRLSGLRLVPSAQRLAQELRARHRRREYQRPTRRSRATSRTTRSYEELAGEIDSAPFYARERVSNAAYLANDSHIRLTSFIAGVTDRYRIGEHFTIRRTLFAIGRYANQPFAHGFTDDTQFNFGARTAFGYDAQLGTVGLTGSLGGSCSAHTSRRTACSSSPRRHFPSVRRIRRTTLLTGSIFTEWSAALPHQIRDLTAGAS